MLKNEYQAQKRCANTLEEGGRVKGNRREKKDRQS